MKKYFFIILLIMIMPLRIYAHEQLKDGWHAVKLVDNTKDTAWAYYKDGVEKLRYSTILYAHRGWRTSPENSLASFKDAKANGYYGFETDVRFTSDNIPVLSHDPYINAIAREKGSLEKLKVEVDIKDKTLAELNKYSFCGIRYEGTISGCKDNPITKFEDAIAYAKESGMYVAIELKEGSKEQIADLVKIVKKYNMNGVVKWISFHYYLLQFVNEASDSEMVGFVGDMYRTYSADQMEKLNQEIKTKNNIVINYDVSGHYFTPDVPEEANSYKQEKYALKTIPQGSLKLNSTSVTLLNNQSMAVNYTYDGDGAVKCVSTNTSYVTCSVDTSKKIVTVKLIKETNSSIKVNVYATQGVKYSATPDIALTVSKKSELKGDVDGNGKIGASDYILIRKYILKTANLNSDQLKLADVNSDGKVGSSDYVAIRKIILSK